MILIIDVSVSPSSEVSKNIFKGGRGARPEAKTLRVVVLVKRESCLGKGLTHKKDAAL